MSKIVRMRGRWVSVCVCVWDACVWKCMHVCALTCTCKWTHVCVYARACIVHLRYVSLCVCVCMFFVYVCIWICMRESEYIALGKKFVQLVNKVFDEVRQEKWKCLIFWLKTQQTFWRAQYLCVCVWIWKCFRVCTYEHVYVWMSMCVDMNMEIWICACVDICVYEYAQCEGMYVNVCIRIYLPARISSQSWVSFF